MKGKWKVTANPMGDRTLYAAYRLRDVNEVDHSGNREYAGEYIENREAVQVIADELNRREEAENA